MLLMIVYMVVCAVSVLSGGEISRSMKPISRETSNQFQNSPEKCKFKWSKREMFLFDANLLREFI